MRRGEISREEQSDIKRAEFELLMDFVNCGCEVAYLLALFDSCIGIFGFVVLCDHFGVGFDLGVV